MPEYKTVKSLQLQTIENFSNYVIEVVCNKKNDLTVNDKYFIQNLHRGARIDVLYYTNQILNSGKMLEERQTRSSVPRCHAKIITRKINIGEWIAILRLLLDTSVNMLPRIRIYDIKDEEILELASLLSNTDNVKNLSVEFVNSHDQEKYPTLLPNSLVTIQHSLENNLASKLCKLELTRICNNDILRVIGANALCLKYLDVSKSLNVDDIGIKYLLIKGNRPLNVANKSASEISQDLNKLYNEKNMLNACCFTLEQLHVTETKFGFISMLTIAACIKTLKIVGANFNACENIYDAIVVLWKNFRMPKREFNITHMHDYNINAKSISIFDECLPHIKSVRTNYNSLMLPKNFGDSERKSLFWDRVEDLNIERHTPINHERFFNFISVYGHNLLKLDFGDNESVIDVAQLLKTCQDLETVQGHLIVFDTPADHFKQLKSVCLMNPDMRTIKWFFENGPHLEDVKLLTDGSLDLKQYIFEDPPLILRNNLKRLQMSNLYDTNLNCSTVIEFIEKCSKLQELGSINTWNLFASAIKSLKLYMRKKNYDIIIY